MTCEGRQSGGGVPSPEALPPWAFPPGVGSGVGVLAQSVVAPTAAQLQSRGQSPSLPQSTLTAWQRSSFDGSHTHSSAGVGTGSGSGVLPSLGASLPPALPALPLQAHCSPADSQEKPAPQSLAAVHGRT